MSAASFLETLYGHGDGWVHLSTLNRQVAAAKCSEVAKLAEKISGRKDVYLSAAVIGSDKGSGDNGRIEDGDATQLTSLWVDLDRAGEPGHKTKDPLWTRNDLTRLYETIPIKPTAVTDSGGGWWWHYTLTDPVPFGENGSGELLLARWARYWENVGTEYGRKVDSVFNPSRIVRAPGSINGKEGNRVAVVKSLYPERTYTADQLDAILPAPEPAASYPASSNGDRPGDDYNRDATVDTMVTLLERHGFHAPRRVGGRIDLTRPGKQARDGHSVTVWPDATLTFWSSASEGLPGTVTLRDRNGASGTYDPFGVYVHVEHGGDFKAAARALNPPIEFKTETEEAVGPLPFLTLADLCAKVDAAGPRKYLIRGIWPSGAYGVHAAEMKAQKTWNAVDLAVSVASGTPWLGTYPIDDPGPVIMFIGEGGEGSIVRRIRAICDSRGLRAEDLPITVCVRAPHLGKNDHMEIFAGQVHKILPKLVTLDPLYLSAAGAKGADLYGMGELLERPQLICDSVDASFMVVTHFNRGNRTGAGRITGAGPAEWGRVLIGVDVKSRHTDPDTKASTVVSLVDVIGGEVPDYEFRLKRIIVADNPASLDSPLRYSVQVVDDDSGDVYNDMPPARRKLLEAVAAVGSPDGATGSQLVDWIAAKYGHGLTRPTVSTELNAAHKDGLVDSVETPGGPTLWFPSGGVGGVVTTPSRHQATGDIGGVLSVSSHIDDTRHPTPQNDTPEVSAQALCLVCDHPIPGGHRPDCPTVKDGDEAWRRMASFGGRP